MRGFPRGVADRSSSMGDRLGVWRGIGVPIRLICLIDAFMFRRNRLLHANLDLLGLRVTIVFGCTGTYDNATRGYYVRDFGAIDGTRLLETVPTEGVKVSTSRRDTGRCHGPKTLILVAHCVTTISSSTANDRRNTQVRIDRLYFTNPHNNFAHRRLLLQRLKSLHRVFKRKLLSNHWLNTIRFDELCEFGNEVATESHASLYYISCQHSGFLVLE